jgi:hypothetical protein
MVGFGEVVGDLSNHKIKSNILLRIKYRYSLHSGTVINVITSVTVYHSKVLWAKALFNQTRKTLQCLQRRLKHMRCRDSYCLQVDPMG